MNRVTLTIAAVIASDNAGNHSLTDSKFLGQVNLPLGSGIPSISTRLAVTLSNFCNLRIRQFRKHACLSSFLPHSIFTSRKGLFPATIDHVSHVFENSPKIQMLRIATRRVVALVKNPHSIWNWAIRDFPSYAMASAIFSNKRNPPITIVVNPASSPRPAFGLLSDFHSRPKSFWKRCFKVSAIHLSGFFENLLTCHTEVEYARIPSRLQYYFQ
jgi:hypothetical protein